MSIDAVSTSSAPAAIGPYSQAIRANGFLFCSGQIALDPATGEIVSDDVREQTERVMKNLAAVLAAGGSGWDRVVKVTIFLADMNDFAAVNAIYGRYFESLTPPARATVAVRTLPRNVAVEIDCIAVHD
ncbi:MAG: RidA family protein [Sandaracinus sp.]|nr:RidA family protein [Sandaracinus sp.]MCB9619024.1 RidA family protein [Sandaracinus sp.]